MEEQERPRKLRKLSHDDEQPGTSAVEDTVDDTKLASVNSSILNGHTHDRDVKHVHDDPGAQTVTNGASHDSQSSSRQLGEIEANNVATQDSAIDSSGRPLSKNQMKRLRKKAEWESKRDERKIVRKEKVIAKRERKKAAREATTEELVAQPPVQETIRRRQLPITIVIDCDFDALMHDGERISLSSQITRSYSDNKNARFRAHLAISSFGGHLRERFDGLLQQMYKSWRGVRFLDTDFLDAAEQAKSWMVEPTGGVLEGAFAKYASADEEEIASLQQRGEVIYLSSEADETLEELKPFSTYIIGGLVDKNREKGLCHRRATQRGVRTAKLPIGDYLDMSSRKVLATNHVNEIMIKWLESRDWADAFIKVIPQRRGGKLKQDKQQSETHTDSDGDAETEDKAEINTDIQPDAKSSP